MKNETTLVSIIVPCFNQGQFLNECIDSLIKQTYLNWECILVDDGSTDNTADIAKKWALQEPRIKYLYKQNGGLSSARNVGLNAAKGSFIQFLDCDDYLFPEKLECSLLASRQFDAAIVVTNFLLFDDRKKRKIEGYNPLCQACFDYHVILMEWDKTFTIPVHCPLIARETIGDLRFNEELKAKEDWFFWLGIYKNQPKTHFLDRELVFLRYHSASMTKNFEFMVQQQLNAFTKLAALIDDNPLYQQYLEHNTQFYIQETNRLKQALILANEKRKLKYLIKKILPFLFR